MLKFFNFWVFVFGLIIGSFLNCIIYRLEKKKSFLFGRSYCLHCCHSLAFWDLIPVLSFLFLKGRCRYCGKKISWQYPLVEIATGFLFLLIFNFQFVIFKEFSIFNYLNLIYYWLISVFLIIIFVYDLKYYIIPDKIIYPAIVLTLIFNFQFLIFKQFTIFNYALFSALGLAFFFFLIVLISRGQWLGLGDVKLVFLMGLLLGWPKILIGLFLTFFIGAIISLILIIIGRKTLKSEVPLAPFLITGLFLTLFWGESLMIWYQKFFMLK